jgi:hypothetical protein
MSARSKEQNFVCFGTVELADNEIFRCRHSQSVHVALYVSSTSLGEQSSESLVDVERQEPRGRIFSSGFGWSRSFEKCENFHAFVWRAVSKSSKKWYCRDRRSERLKHKGVDE